MPRVQNRPNLQTAPVFRRFWAAGQSPPTAALHRRMPLAPYLRRTPGARTASRYAFGSLTVKTVIASPPSSAEGAQGVLAALMTPPWSRAISRAMARPRP